MLIAQISDTHIVQKGSHWVSEPATETDDRLVQVVSFINELNPLPDVVLLTGDATDFGDHSAYEHLKELLQPLKIPLFAIPGNHDLRENFRTAFQSESYMPKHGFIQYAIEDFPLRLIGLDSLVEGKGHGLLCEERISWLIKTILANSEKPALLFFHHPPFKTGMKIFDEIICNFPSSFESFIRNNQQIVGIICGHYHHLCLSTFGNKPCFIAPSVAPVHYIGHPLDEEVSAIELEDPAVTLHRWNPETHTLVSHVRRIKKDYKRLDWNIIKQNI